MKINSDDFTQFIKISRKGQFAQKAEKWKRGNSWHQFVVSFFHVQSPNKKKPKYFHASFRKTYQSLKCQVLIETNDHKN